MFKKLAIILLLFSALHVQSAKILIPMDMSQKDHLKAYGIAYWLLTEDVEVSWLLNYKGGSFMFTHLSQIEKECKLRGVTFQVIADAQSTSILSEIADPKANMDVIKMEKAPKVAVYSPPNMQPWDDAVTLVLTYAQIPYDVVYDKEVLDDKLPTYDWLHLHHEDFTGQYGKFWVSQRNQPWYKEQQKQSEKMAKLYGYSKVSELKLAVSMKIRDFVLGGGFLFAMCSATDSYDVSLAAAGIDICQPQFDHDPMDPKAQSKLNFNNTFAFKDFKISPNPYEYEISNIDINPYLRQQKIQEKDDYFTLFDFSAKWDPVPTMLCQNHTQIIKGFYGQTTAFNKSVLKKDVLVMGENKLLNEARYIHGEFGKGTWTFYGGHDPEDYRHLVGDPPTDLSLTPNSPGYRLILNNVLFPAAKKKKRKT
jgi:hypothetical protein